MFSHYKMELVSTTNPGKQRGICILMNIMTQLFLAQPYANEVIPRIAYPEARARHRALGSNCSDI